MSNVLVTGGAGYIGSHACKALAAAGYQPVVFDNLSGGHREAVRWGPLEIGDVTDTDALVSVMERHRIESVMHFAAYISVGESIVEPSRYYRNNFGGTLSLLAAMTMREVRNLVFSSTAAVYGIPDEVPVPEAAPTVPINPYGWSKLASEQAIADHAVAHGLRFAALRYFNASGADPDGEVGEAHDPETHLIPLALEAAKGGAPLSMFGDNYPTPDGTCVRDYIHVSDLADAHVAALAHLERGRDSARLNLGTGAGLSVRQILDSVERVTGRTVPVTLCPRRPGDPPSLVAAADRARDLLGWSPRRSDVDTIVATAWDWHRRDAAKAGG